MILESILIVIFAMVLDIKFGDPRTKFHPTSWIGTVIAKLILMVKLFPIKLEKLMGVFVILIICSIIISLLMLLKVSLDLINFNYFSIFFSVIIGAVLLKSTIAIKGMQKHAIFVLNALELGDISSARNNLSMIVKRDTKNLDRDHIFSGVIESLSENTVDGITGSLFYFAIFGLPGALVYRAINTADSMIGYKSELFKNIGWFAANCDKILNYIPARLTGYVMILSSLILGFDWRKSYEIMMRDGKKTESLNAGYPMAAIAGALGVKFEKLNYYSLGDGHISFTKDHIHSAISIMRLTSIIFCGIVVIPILILFSFLGWGIYV